MHCRKASWMPSNSCTEVSDADVEADRKQGKIPERMLRLMFRRLDVDNSGGVSLKELRMELADVFHLHYTSQQFLEVGIHAAANWIVYSSPLLLIGLCTPRSSPLCC
jgi:hypothetical protein